MRRRRPADRRRRRRRGFPASPDRAGSRRCATASLTAAMMRSVAATPMSAEISSSSSASIVSTSIGRDRRSGASATADDLVEALDDLLLGARETLADPAEETHPANLSRSPLRPAAGAASARRPPCAHRCGRSSTSAICVAIGSSTPYRAPSASAAPVVVTPSATIFMPARISCSERPRASSMPTWRLRLRAAGAGQHEIAEAAQTRRASRGGRPPRTPAA